MSKKNRKKQRNKKNKEDNKAEAPAPPKPKDPSKAKIELKLEIVRGLLELGIDVPNHKIEDIDKAIEELEKKKAHFEELGQKRIDEIFKSETWQDDYEKELNRADEDFIVREEEEAEEKPKKEKKQEKYVYKEEDNAPLK